MKQSNLMKQLLLLFIFFLTIPVALAQIEYYGVESTINLDQIDYAITLKFLQPTENFVWQTDFSFYNLSVESAFQSNCVAKLKQINCNFSGMSNESRIVKLKFSSLEGIEQLDSKLRYRASYTIPFSIDRAFILIKLPEKAVLAEQPANASFTPADGKVMTDGRRIMVYWDRSNLTAGEGLLFSVSYTLPTPPFDYFGIALIVIIGAFIVSVGFLIFRKIKIRKILTAVLTSDEKAIIDVLTKRGGQALQKQIVRETDFSKAKVSRLIRALQKRAILKIEPVSGRENRVILVLERYEKGSSENSSREDKEAV
jgi:hypothetical protein